MPWKCRTKPRYLKLLKLFSSVKYNKGKNKNQILCTESSRDKFLERSLLDVPVS